MKFSEKKCYHVVRSPYYATFYYIEIRLWLTVSRLEQQLCANLRLCVGADHCARVFGCTCADGGRNSCVDGGGKSQMVRTQ